jgi:hypothetical protein
VYAAEEVNHDGSTFHAACFRCNTCKKAIKATTAASYSGLNYCKPCFMKAFKEKGNYDEGFGGVQHKKKWIQGAQDDEEEEC